MITPEESVDPEIKTRCIELNTLVVKLVATEILKSDSAETVTDRRGRVTQKGIEIPDMLEEGEKVTIDVYNERSDNEPTVEIEHIILDPDKIATRTGFVAFQTHILQNGKTGQRGGEADGLEGEIHWSWPMEYVYDDHGSELYLGFVEKIIGKLHGQA